MKTIIQNNKKTVIPYPKLMISNKGMIVLFVSNRCGTVLHKGDGATALGSYSKDFVMEIFTDFDGKVIISSE
jgi:hypothetical protein